ncbi:MAG: hypothetical protein SLAVMIC_00062 [uncultured marine phage]|uniref:Uncharacterized protein n=1 Tax=uncultured marine phage TaxID=707152 RepID=A0A8D9CBL4_9VIRU|nr:MAG: hypothetical protein SLAVMIC_00062 [uncultured marine phage]
MIKESVKNYLDNLTVIDGKVRLWHYSSHKIDDDFISTSGKQNLHSKNEYQAWGRSRSFFYATKDGISYDSGVSAENLYVCEIPLDKIYDINGNDRGYSGSWEEMYIQSRKDGYTAWIYNLGRKESAPIVISFTSVPIIESYEQAPGGGYREMNKEILDYRIGTINVNGEEKIVMQKDGYKRTLTNTYLTTEPDPRKAMKVYKSNLEYYMRKDVKIDPEFTEDYEGEIE